jgi:hypothetical protein
MGRHNCILARSRTTMGDAWTSLLFWCVGVEHGRRRVRERVHQRQRDDRRRGDHGRLVGQRRRGERRRVRPSYLPRSSLQLRNDERRLRRHARLRSVQGRRLRLFGRSHVRLRPRDVQDAGVRLRERPRRVRRHPSVRHVHGRRSVRRDVDAEQVRHRDLHADVVRRSEDRVRPGIGRVRHRASVRNVLGQPDVWRRRYERPVRLHGDDVHAARLLVRGAHRRVREHPDVRHVHEPRDVHRHHDFTHLHVHHRQHLLVARVHVRLVPRPLQRRRDVRKRADRRVGELRGVHRSGPFALLHVLSARGDAAERRPARSRRPLHRERTSATAAGERLRPDQLERRDHQGVVLRELTSRAR